MDINKFDLYNPPEDLVEKAYLYFLDSALARKELIKANKKTITKLICLVMVLKIIYKKSK